MNTKSCGTGQASVRDYRRYLDTVNKFSQGLANITSEQIGLFFDRALNLAEATLPDFEQQFSGVCDFPDDSCCDWDIRPILGICRG